MCGSWRGPHVGGDSLGGPPGWGRPSGGWEGTGGTVQGRGTAGGAQTGGPLCTAGQQCGAIVGYRRDCWGPLETFKKPLGTIGNPQIIGGPSRIIRDHWRLSAVGERRGPSRTVEGPRTLGYHRTGPLGCDRPAPGALAAPPQPLPPRGLRATRSHSAWWCMARGSLAHTPPPTHLPWGTQLRPCGLSLLASEGLRLEPTASAASAASAASSPRPRLAVTPACPSQPPPRCCERHAPPRPPSSGPAP